MFGHHDSPLNPPAAPGAPVERTLVVIKPDGVQRNLIGEIIRRFETPGLQVRALKMLRAPPKLIEQHYFANDEYLVSLGKKSEAAGDVVKDYKAQGMMIIQGLRTFLAEGPVVAMVLEGPDAIKRVRAITGSTDPASAPKGTIRGDLPADSILKANQEKRAVRNLVHASGNPEEAAKEIQLWFTAEELA